MLDARARPRANLASPTPRKMSVDETWKDSEPIARLIDHTMLKPGASQEEIARLCSEARHCGFAAVCVNPYWVRFAAATLDASRVKVCATVGFPLGANESSTKLAEAETALLEGAKELDVVQNIGALRSGHFGLILSEFRQLSEIAHARGAILKVILEMCLLNEDEKATACRLAVEAGVDFVKTSTGFAQSGATLEDVRLMRRIVGDVVGLKAAGGIRTLAAVRAMLEAGANRIGTSSGVQILRELEAGESADPPKYLAAARIPGGHPDAY